MYSGISSSSVFDKSVVAGGPDLYEQFLHPWEFEYEAERQVSAKTYENDAHFCPFFEKLKHGTRNIIFILKY